jgi:hypothetical protein
MLDSLTVDGITRSRGRPKRQASFPEPLRRYLKQVAVWFFEWRCIILATALPSQYSRKGSRYLILGLLLMKDIWKLSHTGHGHGHIVAVGLNIPSNGRADPESKLKVSREVNLLVSSCISKWWRRLIREYDVSRERYDLVRGYVSTTVEGISSTTYRHASNCMVVITVGLKTNESTHAPCKSPNVWR